MTPPLNDPGFDKMLGNTIDKLKPTIPTIREMILEKGRALGEFTMERLQADLPHVRPELFRRVFSEMVAVPEAPLERITQRWPYLYKVRV